MQKRWIFLSLTACLALSCTTPTKSTLPDTGSSAARAPQAVEDERDIKHENTFKALMNMDGRTEEESNYLRAREIQKYMRRQLTTYYIAQDLVDKFDAKLEGLYQTMKRKDPNSINSPDPLEKERIQLNIAWEFKERNLEDVQYIYSRLLEESNKADSPYQQASQIALNSMDNFFNKEWQSGDKRAVFSLITDFEPINEIYQIKHGQGKIPGFHKYLKEDIKEQWKTLKTTLKLLQHKKNNHIDKLMQKEWEKYQVERWQDHVDAMKEREPQSDTLYPDSGGYGNITGNRFSPGVWAITLDDGPHPTYTPAMINTIEGAGMRATFFWLSQNIQAHPNLPKLAAEHNFRRGNHSYSHANLPTLGEAGLKREIDDAYDIFTRVVGEPPTFFRCPYGACGGNGSRIRQKIADHKMMHVFWNVDSLDWQDKNPESIFQRVKKQMEVNGHGIVLFHDIHPQSVEAMKLVVAYIKSKPNWKTYTMDEIFKLETGNDYHSP